MLPSTLDALKSVLRTDPTLSPTQRAALVARLRHDGPPPPRQPAPLAEARLVRRAEAARRLACSLRTVDKLAAAGVLQKRRLPGRVRASGFLSSDLDALLLAGGAHHEDQPATRPMQETRDSDQACFAVALESDL